MHRFRSFRLALAAALVGMAGAGTYVAAQEGPPIAPGTRSVLFVANNWDGTADIVDPQTFAKLGRLNVIPDLQERMREIATDPRKLGYFLAIRQLIGEGNDQFADDMFSSHDGRYVYISRPSLADVVGIEVATGKIVWRFPMEGNRADHMAISPDGTRIYHASIGLVYTPADQPIADSTKGDRWFQIVDARTYQVIKRLDIGQILEANGHPGYSSAVRPMAIAPGEKTAYFQLSFHHGFVEFDLETDKPLRIANLPLSEEARNTPREQYLLDSAHHGLAMNPEGTKLCAAGTMSDYAAIVSRETFAYKIFDVGKKPYWSTNSADGRYCFVSASGDDKVVVLDYASEQQVAEIPVGDHPQRMRMGLIRSDAAGTLPSAAPAQRPARAPAKLGIARARVRDGRLDARLHMTARATGRLRATYTSNGRRTRFRVRIPRARVGKPLAWTIKRRLPAGQRRRSTGILQLRYAGNPVVRPDRLRSRVAARRALLRRSMTAIEAGALVARGTVSRRARGVVRVRMDYVDDNGNDVNSLRYRAPIRGGRWALREQLPSKPAGAGGQLSIQYTGHLGRRIRGEQLSKAVRP